MSAGDISIIFQGADLEFLEGRNVSVLESFNEWCFPKALILNIGKTVLIKFSVINEENYFNLGKSGVDRSHGPPGQMA